MTLGFEAAGWEVAFHAEIDPQAERVLATRWPHTPRYGEVRELHGAALLSAHGRITCLSGGSPCQDLSVAGRRAGLSGDRSSLFFHQVRLWRELAAPWCLWENVLGTLSSNEGEDFRCVLEAFVGSQIERPVARTGRVLKWANAGWVCGPTGMAAWRVFDAQHWGVPQRRRRVFVLAARPGAGDPREVLFESPSMSGDSRPSGATQQTASHTARAGATTDSVYSLVLASDPVHTVDVSQPITGRKGDPGCVVLVNARSGRMSTEVSGTLQSASGRQGYSLNKMPVVLTVNNDSEGGGGVDVAAALRAGMRAQQSVVPFDVQQVTSRDNRTKVEPRSAALSLTTQGRQCVFRMQAFGQYSEDVVASAIKARDYKDATDLIITLGRPRRLLPLEGERLMGWPDEHTKTLDSKGRPIADAVRYRVIGNGVVSMIPYWIAQRLEVYIRTNPPD